MTKCPDTSLTEEGRHFAARDGAEDDGLERCVVATTTTPIIERARRTPPPDPNGSGTKSNDDAMMTTLDGESPPRDRSQPQGRRRRCDRRKISRAAAVFLVAFGGGAVVGLMVLRNNDDGESSSPNPPLVSVSYVEPTGGGGGANEVSSSGGDDDDASTDDTFAAAGANEPPAAAAGLLRSTRSPSPSMSLPPTVEPVDASSGVGGAWYSVQRSPSPTTEVEAPFQSNGASTIAPPTDEIIVLSPESSTSSTAIPSQNGTAATASAPTGINPTSAPSIVTEPSNSPAPTPPTIDLSSWIDAFDSFTIVPETTVTTTTTATAATTTTTTTTTTTSAELDEVTSNSTSNSTTTTTTTTTTATTQAAATTDTFNETTAAGGGGGAPCLTDEACDAQRQKLGFDYYQVGDYEVKGCYYKNDVAYFGLNGTVQEMSTASVAQRIRIWCDDLSQEIVADADSNSEIVVEVADSNSSEAPNTAKPMSQSPTTLPSSSPTTAIPTAPNPTLSPATLWPTHPPTTNIATTPPTSNSTTSAQFNDTITNFYLMADCPYSANERDITMPAYIEQLSADVAQFLVHLGDLQSVQESNCEEWAYQNASNILRKSRVPTFVLPGDNDMNDCDDVQHGEEMWTKYFRRFDERWDHDFVVTRWGDLDESFSFLHKGVLYFGVNVPGGTPYSSSVAEVRNNVHLERIGSILNGLSDDDYRVIVLLGHVDPTYGNAGNSQDFFEGFANIVRGLGKPTVYFHGDRHEYYELEGGEHGVDDYLRISLDGESIAPPIRVEIDVSKVNPIKVSRRKSGLAVDCCSDGWPSHEEL